MYYNRRETLCHVHHNTPRTNRKQEDKAMANQCSELNRNCLAKKGTPCPAFDSGRNCWEHDWAPLLKNLRDDDRERWKEYMRETCPKCPAFRQEMKERIADMEETL